MLGISEIQMDSFCNSPLWDMNVTWNTDDPKFTPCFQETVLSWTPCLFLWFFAPFSIRNLMKRQIWIVPWGWLNLTKLLLTIALVFLSLADLANSLLSFYNGKQVYLVWIVTPAVKSVTFVLATALVILNKTRRTPSSPLLFLFWFLMVVCNAPQYKDDLTQLYNQKTADIVPYIILMVYYPTVFTVFILNFLADPPSLPPSFLAREKVCPIFWASFPSVVLFSWFNSLVWMGYKRPIEAKDLWSLAEEDSAKGIASKFDSNCKKRVCKQSRRTRGTESSQSLEGESAYPSDKTPPKEMYPTIWISLIKSFWPSILFGFSLKLGCDILLFVNPFILRLLISFTKSDEEAWHGYLYAAALLIAASFETLLEAHHDYAMRKSALKVQVALTAAIYKKALKVSSASRKESTSGEIVNMMSVDAQRFVDLMQYLSIFWSAPLQITVSIYFLWSILGPSVLGGIIVMVAVIFINIPLARKSETLNGKQMEYKDERIKHMNEIISGMKVLKLYAWEVSFEEYILKIRTKELKMLKQLTVVNTFICFIWACTPIFVALVTFSVYIMVDSSHTLGAEEVFSTVALFNILKFPLVSLPILISDLVQTLVSARRIDKFMNSDELDPNCVSHSAAEKDPLVIEEGNFSWCQSAPILCDINISVKDKTLAAVVGSVGSGKSSLLSAFLGEMDCISGRVNTQGSIAYVSQQAWILNATLRDNILFGHEYVEHIYNKVIEACALVDDLALLSGGDQTEIGEKGINLSGGQKQRVSLARAVYSHADLYFLDDPLSAVDSHVGKHIFEKVIGPRGLLKNKTRLFVTHGLTYLPEVDEIYVLKSGKISEHGTYNQLINEKGAFAEIIQIYSQEPENNSKTVEGARDIPQLSSSPISKWTHSGSLASSPRIAWRRHSIASEEESSSALRTHVLPTDETPFRPSSEEDPILPRSSERDPLFSSQKGAGTHNIIEEEIAQTGNVRWSVFSYYLRAIGWLFVFFALLAALLFQSFSIGSNFWLAIWTTKNHTSSDPNQDKEERNQFLEIYAFLGLFASLSAVAADLVPRFGCVNACRKLHGYLLHSILRAPLSFSDTTPSGRILSRFSKDIDVLDYKLPYEMMDAIFCVMEGVGILFIIVYATPVFLYCIFPLALVYFILQRLYTATSRQLQRLESISKAPIFSHFSETVAGAQVIRAFGVTERFIRESDTRIDTNQMCLLPAAASVRWLGVRLQTIGNLIIFFAAFFAVLERDTLSAGLVGLSISYALQVTNALNWFVRMASNVETDIVAVERVKDYIETNQEAEWDIPAIAPPLDWPSRGNIIFKNFKVRYRSGLDLVLKGLDFSVNEKEKVGIVGRTGAGKSSLTLALFRIIEAAEGSIHIDGIDISELGLHALRSKLTVIPQDPVLFTGSLRMNLDPLNIYSDAKIWHALELSHLKVFVKSLENGLEYEVAEGGENFSVGQRQLICLARALLRKTKILILDEATAAVDVETDNLIQNTIRSEFSDCTILTIAHRLNTIMDSDRVLVLDQGLIKEYDSPTNLLRNQSSLFYSLVKDANMDIEAILAAQNTTS